MVRHIVHLFILPLRALVMVVATFPTGHACGGPVTGHVCPMPPGLHHHILHAKVAPLSAQSVAGPVTWRIAPAKSSQPGQ
jgi:hypothetical protein